MKVAIPHWQGRVSPVFDVAGNVLLVDVASGGEQARQNVVIDIKQAHARVRMLSAHGATVLICGAISRPLELALSAAGIKVIPHTCGDIEEVLAAFINGLLDKDAFLMPGCGDRRNRLQSNRSRSGRCRQCGKKGGDNNAQR